MPLIRRAAATLGELSERILRQQPKTLELFVDTESTRQRLLARRNELRSRAARANAGLRQQPDLANADNGDVSNQTEQNGLLSALSRTADAEVQRIDAALRRLNEGRYGICVLCGEPIEPQRLEAVPYTDRCSVCAERSVDA